MKKKNKTKEKTKEEWLNIPVAIYGIHVIVCINQSVDDVVAWGKYNGVKPERFSKEWIKTFDEAVKSSVGFVDNLGDANKDIIIWLEKRPLCIDSYGVLYHEIYHVVEKIANYIDEPTSLYNTNMISEPRAYLYEYLANRANEFFWDNKMKGKNK